PGDAWTLTPEAVRRVCARTTGVGADGIVWVDPAGPPFRLRMFNPDGGEFERSGNGLRVLASWLHATGRAGDDSFPVEVGGDRVELQVLSARDGRYDVVADMGPCRAGAEERMRAGDDIVSLVRASVGNPHAVVWGDPEPWDAPPTLEALARIGPALAAGHPAFPHGTNVQLARVEGAGVVRALVWERGVGRTSASGTSACAVAAAAVATGRTPAGEVEVRMEGGTLAVRIDRDLDARLRGPVVAVMTGEMAPALAAG
ncbi:MAG: diaminopimelate epimerase, partial [Longimicrobiales bacterium]|nr:diaminopimelate epimerase [Longimicrobiales bacterium]